MAEDVTAAVRIPPSLNRKTPSRITSFRFLTFPEHPNPAPSSGNQYELDEDDVLWSPDHYSGVSSAGIDSRTSTVPSGGDSFTSYPSGVQHRPFIPEKVGLSTVLAENRRPLMHTRPAAIKVPAGRSVPAEVSAIVHQSAPVNVPVWPGGRRLPPAALIVMDDVVEDDKAGEDDGEREEMLPPHVIVAKSHATTFSVIEGAGRTLKGRDLRRVRNAVFQKTGFLD